MDPKNTIQPLQEIPQPLELPQQATINTAPPAKDSRRRLLLVIGLLVLGIVICVPICQFLVGFAASFPEEMASTAQVIDKYMTAMATKDVDYAYTLVSKGDESQVGYSNLVTLTRGNNYVLFEGYREISFTDFNMTQVGAEKYVQVTGNILYVGDWVGEFSAVLIKENGTWKIQEIRVSVPPDKFGKARD